MGGKWSRNYEIVRRWNKGESCGLLAEAYNLSRERICQIVKLTGRRRRVTHATIRRGMDDGLVLAEEDVDRFIEDGMSHQALADDLGHKTSSVCRALRKRGISSQYNQRKHERWTRVMAAIYKRHMAGETVNKIAREYGRSAKALQVALVRFRKEHGLPVKVPRIAKT